MKKMIRILFVGDVVGNPGRRAFAGIYPELKEREGIDFSVVNAENAAGGSGITGKVVGQLLSAGADVLTAGDHIWRKKEIFEIIGEERRIIRPANFPPGTPGRGSGIFTTSAGIKIGVINLLGRVFMNPIDCPFRQCDREIGELSRETRIIVADFHAEATSEKVAMGYYCDGRISALIGTHTHIPTADERIMPGGMAYITDIGMTAASRSILGREVEPVLKNFTTRLPYYFNVSGERPVLQGVIVEIDTLTGKAVSIKRVSEEYVG